MAAESFAAALALVLRHEGGFVDHPLDPGGATNLGITQATLAAHRGRAVTREEVRALAPAEAGDIYRKRYWNAIRADALPPGLDLAAFDLAVNSGPARAIRMLAAIVGLPNRRAVDAALLDALRAGDPVALVHALSATRLAFLRRLKTWNTFGRGWARRVAETQDEALALVARPPSSPPETIMTDAKSILSGRTVWTNGIGLAAFLLSTLDFDTSGVDAGRVTETALQLVTGGSFLASTFFRVIATRRLAK